MKKLWKLLLISVIALMCAGAFIACKGERPKDTAQYTLTVQNGTGGGTFDEGTSVTVTAVIPAGKVFVSWNEGGTVVSAVNPYIFKLTKTMTLTAVFEDEPDGFSLESANGFTMDGNSGFTVVSNATDNFSFIGLITVSAGATWSLCEDISGAQVIPTRAISLNPGDNTVYILVVSASGNDTASYAMTVRRRPMYTVTFDTKGGAAVAPQQVEEDSLAVQPVNEPERTGYTFADWNFDFSTPITENVTITSDWTANEYTVTFNSDGGTLTNETLTVTYDAPYAFAEETHGIYYFGGWYTEEHGGGSLYAISGTWTETNNLTLYAYWAGTSGLAYSLNGDGYSVSKGTANAESIVVPDYYSGKSVTSISDEAFSGCTGITSITIPGSVTSIGEYAFYNCSGITSITIPDSVTSIGDDAFSSCSGLTSITIPDVVTSIGDYVFNDCSGLTSITIPDSVISIGNYAFRNCAGLTSITIPNGVTSIGSYAFSYCGGLTSMIIPDSVTSIRDEAFFYCSGLISITIPDGVTRIGNEAFSYCSGLTSITIPDSVTSIGASAFSECAGLMSITIPDSVTSISGYAFHGCTGLTSIIISDSITSIGASTFYGCTGLTSITIPDGVTSIGYGAFSGCKGLMSMTIPGSVTSIGGSAFAGCTNLSVTWHYNPALTAGVFSRYLKTVIIDDSVTSIGNSAFQGCAGLTSITIPDSVTSIGNSAFSGCTGLTSIVVNATMPPALGSGALSNVPAAAQIFVPAASVDLYKAASGWSDRASYITAIE